MSNFWTRTVTGLSMVFLIIASLIFSKFLFSLFFFFITVLGLWEFFRIIASDNCQPQKSYGTLAGILIYILIVLIGYLGNLLYFFYIIMVPIHFFFFSFIIEIFRRKPQPVVNIATTIMGMIWISFPFAMLNLMFYRQPVYGFDIPVYLAGYFIITWVYDTGAYLYGKSFGKNKFFERISPKKTWEGTIAGIAAAIVIALVIAMIAPVIPVTDWLVLTGLIVIFGTSGDLIESLFKRSLNLKDSGSLLPGHGGILDRFDAILISAPFVFLHFLIRVLII